MDFRTSIVNTYKTLKHQPKDKAFEPCLFLFSISKIQEVIKMNEKTKSLDDTGCGMSAIVKRNAIMESEKNEPIIITDPKGVIVVDRKILNNNNTFVLGRSGTGKATSCIVSNKVSAQNDKF